ncbi:MAG TPA: geranylgeranyl reductase family protein [Candidatus Elarobacter sp.]|nr:geranylgeranyl reductase family protein [Candidatus Elarobacter sp.]
MSAAYDAVVIGAGPAGCAAAYDLVAAGRSVLLVDQRAFPRVKACAGGVTVKTLRALRYSIAPVIREVCSEMVVARGYERARTLASNDPLCAMTVREELDAYCLRQTVARGAEFRIAKRIAAVVEDETGVDVTLDDEPVRARYLVAADGVNSRVRQLLGGAPPVRGFALEACVARERAAIPPMVFQFGVVEAGYGWLFPKGDHVNVGLYTNDPAVRISRDDVAAFAERKLGTDALTGFVGHHIGLGGCELTQPWRRVFLVGDAAGLVDPLLGEGIYNAIVSGQAAARAIAEATAPAAASAKSVFARYLAPIVADLASTYRTARFFYKHLVWGFRALTFPPSELALMRGTAAGLTFSQAKHGFLLAPFRRAPQIDSIAEWQRFRQEETRDR